VEHFFGFTLEARILSLATRCDQVFLIQESVIPTPQVLA
jgi:hypothetical protein